MSDVTLLDGGMGQELVKRSGKTPTPLWSTSVMLDAPDLVSALHRDYFAAGATVASTNSYALHRDRLADTPFDGQLEALAKASVDLAAAALPEGGRIAGTIGPLGASYRPDICPPPEVAAPLYAEVAGFLGDRVDVLLPETLSSVAQAEGALLGLKNAGKPVWAAVTVMDDDGTRLRSGEPVAALAGLLERYRPDAILVNCSRPEAVSQAVAQVAEFGLPFGAYANGFTRITEAFLGDKPTVDALSARADLTPEAYAEFVMGWVAAGATIVGGCCETGPDHIAEIARQLRAAGHTII